MRNYAPTKAKLVYKKFRLKKKYDKNGMLSVKQFTAKHMKKGLRTLKVLSSLTNKTNDEAFMDFQINQELQAIKIGKLKQFSSISFLYFIFRYKDL